MKRFVFVLTYGVKPQLEEVHIEARSYSSALNKLRKYVRKSRAARVRVVHHDQYGGQHIFDLENAR